MCHIRSTAAPDRSSRVGRWLKGTGRTARSSTARPPTRCKHASSLVSLRADCEPRASEAHNRRIRFGWVNRSQGLNFSGVCQDVTRRVTPDTSLPIPSLAGEYPLSGDSRTVTCFGWEAFTPSQCLAREDVFCLMTRPRGILRRRFRADMAHVRH